MCLGRRYVPGAVHVASVAAGQAIPRLAIQRNKFNRETSLVRRAAAERGAAAERASAESRG
jgi:hypothetical protein